MRRASSSPLQKGEKARITLSRFDVVPKNVAALVPAAAVRIKKIL